MDRHLRGSIAPCLFLILFIFFISACSSKTGTDSNLSGTQTADTSARLVNATDSGDLEKRIKAELIRRYDRQYDYAVYAGTAGGGSMGAGTPTGAMAAASSFDNAAGAGAHSDTNVQEAGVDEGDAVKTDGAYLYLARGTHFFILSANPADQASVVCDIDIQEPITELHLSGTKVVIITTPVMVYSAGSTISKIVGSLPAASATKVYEYDVTDPSAPILAAGFDFPGYVQGSRRIDNVVYLVTNYTIDLPFPAQCADYLAAGTAYDQQAYLNACELAREDNVAAINAMTLDQMLPSYTVFSGGTGSSITGPVVTPDDVYIPESGNGTDISLVIRIDLSGPAPAVSSSGVLSSWAQIYMSLESLYLASGNQWLWIQPVQALGMPAYNPQPKTQIHKFAISSSDKPVYRGSAVVDGWLNDRFSMGEYLGYLRIGTTSGGWWGQSISNQLAVLGENASAPGCLIQTGRITGLAPGERIYSMRFDQNRGYMVTFRQVDPLFTFDLTDPANPKKAGEIEVTGVATYIHLLGTDTSKRLLTIGRSVDPATGQATGNKLQMFDVTNLASPKLLAGYELGAGWSNALYDPHAFLYYEPLGVLTIPYFSYGTTGSYSSGLDVFRIGQSAIVFGGTIPAPVLTTGYGSYDDTVDRSVIIGNNIFSIAHRSVTAAGADLLNIIKVIDLPESYLYYGTPVVVSGGTGTGIVAGTGTIAPN